MFLMSTISQGSKEMRNLQIRTFPVKETTTKPDISNRPSAFQHPVCNLPSTILRGANTLLHPRLRPVANYNTNAIRKFSGQDLWFQE